LEWVHCVRFSSPLTHLVTGPTARNLKTAEDSCSRKFCLNPNKAVVLQVSGVKVWGLSVTGEYVDILSEGLQALIDMRAFV
jgi:hypothetical protein